MVLARYQSPDPVNVSRPPKGLAVDADNKIHFLLWLIPLTDTIYSYLRPENCQAHLIKN